MLGMIMYLSYGVKGELFGLECRCEWCLENTEVAGGQSGGGRIEVVNLRQRRR